MEEDYDAWRCDDCNGDGWYWAHHQVAERKSDTQELKTECAACEGVGWFGPDREKAAQARV